MEILVAREADAFSRILTERGFAVINLPLVKTEPLEDLSEFSKDLENLDRFDGVFITSRSAAKIFLREFEYKLFGGKFYVFGKRSADLFNRANLKTYVCGEAKTAAEFLDSIPKGELEGKNFLVLGGTRSLRVVPETLKEVAEVRETIIYQTIAVEPDEEKLSEIQVKFARGEIKAICFFSPSGAEEFLKRFEHFTQSEIKIAVVGETTARFVESKKLRADFISTKPAAENFASELIKFLEK